MSKFYSVQAFQEMVAQYVANGFTTSAAEQMVNEEEEISMKEWDLFQAEIDLQALEMDADSWIDSVDSTSFHTDIDN
jgi:hypothetical protein